MREASPPPGSGAPLPREGWSWPGGLRLRVFPSPRRMEADTVAIEARDVARPAPARAAY